MQVIKLNLLYVNCVPVTKMGSSLFQPRFSELTAYHCFIEKNKETTKYTRTNTFFQNIVQV